MKQLNEDHCFADGDVDRIAPASDGETLIQRCCQKLGCNRMYALSIIAWADEDMPAREMDRTADMAEETRAALAEMQYFFSKAFHVLIAYQDSQTEAQFIRMSTRAMALALGFKLAAGADNATELARVLGLDHLLCSQGKATVHKCVEQFVSERLKLPPLPGQRAAAARANMSQSRQKQLQPSHPIQPQP